MARQKLTQLDLYVMSDHLPVNRHAINPNKLESAEVYQKTECCGETNCSSSFKPGASKLALLALAEELDKTTINRFMRRYEEGYDLTDDVLYIAWKKLKKASMRQPLTDLT